MKIKLTLCIILYFIGFRGHSQCNYNQSIGILSPQGNIYKSDLYSESAKTSVRFNNGFLFASILSYFQMLGSVKKTELVLLDSCGAIINRKTIDINCTNNLCQKTVRAFAYKQDTALLVFGGNYLSVFKVSKNLNVSYYFTDSTYTKMVTGVLGSANGNLLFIEDTSSASAVRIYDTNGNLISRYETSAMAPNGFWVAYASGNLLQGHAIGNNNYILEIGLDSSGFPLTNNLYGPINLTLIPKQYAISNPKASGAQAIAIANGKTVSIFPYSGKQLGNVLFTQTSFNEAAFGNLFSLALLNDGELVLHTNNESFLWQNNGKVITCLPFTVNKLNGFPGFNNWSNPVENFQSFYANKSTVGLDTIYTIHSAGELITYGPSASGNFIHPGKLRGGQCSKNDTFLTISSIPSSISSFPASFNFTINNPDGDFGDPKLIFDNQGVEWSYSSTAGNLANIGIKAPLSSQTTDSLKMCVLAYNYGGVPRKICTTIKLNQPPPKQAPLKNSNQIIQTSCGMSDTSYGERIAPSYCMDFGGDVLYTSIFNCSNSGFSPKLECRLFNPSGEQLYRLTSSISCDTTGCVEGAIPFPYTKDTALIATYGNQGLTVYKASKDFNKIIILFDPSIKQKPRDIKLLQDKTIAILMDTNGASCIYLFSETGLVKRVFNETLAPNGIWVSNLILAEDIINAYFISLDDRTNLYKMKLRSNGQIIGSDTTSTIIEKLAPNKFSIQKSPNGSNLWIGQVIDGKASIKKLKQDNTLENLITNYSINQKSADTLSFFSLNGSFMILATNNEIYVWDSLGTLKTCMPYNYSHYQLNGTTRTLMDGKIESNFLMLGSTETQIMIQYAATERIEKNAFVYSYGRQVGRIIEKNNFAEPYFSNLASSIKTLPYKNQIYYNTTSPEFNWQTLWETNKPHYFNWNDQLANSISINIKDSNQSFMDTINLCAIKYIAGTTPFKSCRTIVINTFKTNLLEEGIPYEIKVFPNPSTGKYLLNLEGPELKGTYKIYSITGVLILSGTYGGLTEIDLGKNDTGVYVLRIQANEKSLNTLLIKE